MPETNVNQKGVIGLVKVITDLTINGYQVFAPMSDYSPIDLIVGNVSMILKRLQIKYREPTRVVGDNSEYLGVSFDSIVNGKRMPVDTSLIDAWAIYCPTTDKVYYVRSDEVSKRSIRICLNDLPRRKNPLADDFLGAARLWKVNRTGS